MAAALRSLRRAQQVLLLPKINVTSVRMQSGGKSSPHTGISKTLVSFPVKVSHFQQPATGENRNDPLKPVKAALLDLGESGEQSDREIQLGQEVSHSSAQSVHGTPHKDDDSSSSSSSSDSSSDSENEGEDNASVTELQATKEKSGGEYKGLTSVIQKSSSSPGHTSLEKERPIAEEQQNKMGMRGSNAEDLQDNAPVVSTDGHTLHPAPLSAKITLPGADKMETPDGIVPTEGMSSTTAVASEKIKILSTSEELPTGGVVTLATESRDTQLLSTTTSEELPVESVKMEAPQSKEIQILSTTSSEELPAEGVETLALKSMETQILATSEELPAGGEEMLAPQSVETQIPSISEELPEGGVETQILSTTSEELPEGGVETQILSTTSEELPEGGVEAQILSTTSEELPAEEGVAELHESHSHQESCAAPQEPFDNTKYQNLQHFNYTPFTFVDMDVELAKYRLPQPSSGRPSPRQ